jgi:hypothetical protein
VHAIAPRRCAREVLVHADVALAHIEAAPFLPGRGMSPKKSGRLGRP